MPHTMPKNPNWRKKKDEPARPALQIDVRHFDAETAKRAALREKKAELKSLQSSRNHLVSAAAKKIEESAGKRLPRRKMLAELVRALPDIPAHVLSSVTAPAVPAGRA